MKNAHRIVIATVALFSLTLTSQAQAQYQAKGDDGITASPKVRQMLRDKQGGGSAPGDKIDRTVQTVPPRTLALQESLRKVGSAPGDKIDRTAVVMSPKARELTGRSFQVAPVK